jgi:Zn-dependent M16 (insulinase) family peptidase
LFPSDEEETGMVSLAWHGPKWGDMDRVSALSLLWKYLSDSSVSPLHKVFVEIEEPYCSTLYYSYIENAVICQVNLFTKLTF